MTEFGEPIPLSELDLARMALQDAYEAGKQSRMIVDALRLLLEEAHSEQDMAGVVSIYSQLDAAEETQVAALDTFADRQKKLHELEALELESAPPIPRKDDLDRAIEAALKRPIATYTSSANEVTARTTPTRLTSPIGASTITLEYRSAQPNNYKAPSPARPAVPQVANVNDQPKPERAIERAAPLRVPERLPSLAIASVEEERKPRIGDTRPAPTRPTVADRSEKTETINKQPTRTRESTPTSSGNGPTQFIFPKFALGREELDYAPGGLVEYLLGEVEADKLERYTRRELAKAIEEVKEIPDDEKEADWKERLVERLSVINEFDLQYQRQPLDSST